MEDLTEEGYAELEPLIKEIMGMFEEQELSLNQVAMVVLELMGNLIIQGGDDYRELAIRILTDTDYNTLRETKLH